MITVSQEQLKNALSIVGRVIPPRATLPVLTHVCLSTLDGRLHVTGTDLEQFVVVDADTSGQDVDICVPFSIFSKYVSELKDDDVTLEQDGTRLLLRQEDVKAEFEGIPWQEFPTIPLEPVKNVFVLDTAIVRWAFQSVLHAAATDESRPILTGLYVRYENDILSVVTADGYRLALTNIEYKSATEPFCVIIPAKMANVVLRVSQQDGDSQVCFDEKRVSISLPEDKGLQTTVYSQLIEGSYVNYKQIVPDKIDPVVVSNDVLVKAIKRSAVFASQAADNTTFLVSNGRMVLKSGAGGYGSSDESIPVTYAGDDVEFALNYVYLLDAIATCGDVVNIEVTSSVRPVVVSSSRDEHLCVLMPMHLNKG